MLDVVDSYATQVEARVDNTKSVSNWPIVADACLRIVYKCI